MSVAASFLNFYGLSPEKKAYVEGISAAISTAHKLILQEQKRPGQSASLPRSSKTVTDLLRETIKAAVTAAGQGYREATLPGIIGSPFKFFLPMSIYQFITNRADEPDYQRVLDEMNFMEGAVEVISDARFAQLDTTMVQAPAPTMKRGGMSGLGYWQAAVAIGVVIVVLIGAAWIVWNLSEMAKAKAEEAKAYAGRVESARLACQQAKCSPDELKEVIEQMGPPPAAAPDWNKIALFGAIGLVAVGGAAVLLGFKGEIKAGASAVRALMPRKQLSGYSGKSLWD